MATRGYDNCLFMELAASGSLPDELELDTVRGGKGGGMEESGMVKSEYNVLSTITPLSSALCFFLSKL